MNMVAWRKANRLVLMLAAPVFVLALVARSSLPSSGGANAD